MDAIDDLGDALETTRNFLTPVDAGLWLKLAVVVFFVSSLGMGGVSAPSGDVGMMTGETTFEEDLDEALAEVNEELDTDITAGDVLTALLVIGAVLLALWLIYAAIAGVMEFVFIESLRSTEVHVRQYFRANLGKGIRLFLFRIGLLLVVGIAATVLALLVWDGGLAELSNGLIATYLLLLGAIYILYSIVSRFTSDFVAPIMLLEDRGVLSAWGRFWGAFTGNWTEYVVYLVIVWILSIAVSIAAWFLVAFGLFAIAIPFVIAIVLLLFLGPIGGIVAALVGLLGLVVAMLFVALVWAPIASFFQYYALLLLGDTDETFDLIPDQRAAVRAGADAGYGGGEWDEPDRTEASSTWDESADDPDPWEERDPDRSGERDPDHGDERDPWDETASERDEDADPWGDDDDGDDDDERGW